MFGRLTALVAMGIAGAVVATAAAATGGSTVIASGLDDPRGIATLRGGDVTVVETLTGAVTRVGGGETTIATLPGAVDVALGRFQETFVVTGGAPEEAEAASAAQAGSPPAASLLRVQGGGRFTVIADIAAYQRTDPDPDDLEGVPEESNPNGLALLFGRSGTLVADAAGNDLLRVDTFGSVSTVARFKPEVVPFPELDDPPPFFPPAGTPVPAEAVPTAVAIGPDGAWYVSELKGFPFAQGTSRIWRVEAGSRNAVCDPENPDTGPCTTYADGFTGVIDLTFGDDGTLYVLELVKAGLLALEFGTGADPTGALWAVKHGQRRELVPGELLLPGGVAAGRNDTLFVTAGTLFGPGGGTVVQIPTR